MSDFDRFSARVCLVTGATSGIGRAAALALAREGATVVVAGRDTARTAATAHALARESGNPRVTGLVADLSLQADVRRLAREFSAMHDRLHVLVNNAGAVFRRRAETPDGLERTFALNHLAPFLLTALLEPQLRAAAPARVVNVAAGMEAFAHIDFDDLQVARAYHGFKAYARSKLANVMFTAELARRLAGSGVTANCLHPGVVATRFSSGNGRLWDLAQPLLRLARTPAQGADTAVWLASSPDVQGVTGRYFADRKERRPNRQARDPEACRRLWEASARLTGLSAP